MSEPTIRYASICSGVEAASLAWEKLDWKPVWFSEVEPFPCKVLAERFGASSPVNPLEPEDASNEKDRKERANWLKAIRREKMPSVTEAKVPNLGDMSKINGKKYHGKIDLLVGGTPCQDLSVAGKRAGFNGARSSLALDFVRLAYESGCKWFVWENVPGVFSSNGGGDFATLLSLFTGIEINVPKNGFANAGFVCNNRRDRYGVAWRVLDAQFTRTSGFPFAVPQRRRRVFVVGYFGDWTRAAQVLLEYDRLQWGSPPCRKTRKELAGDAGIGLNQTSRNYQITAGNGKSVDVSCTLDVKCKDGAIRNQQGMAIVETGKGFFNESQIAGTLEGHEDQHRRNILIKCGESMSLASGQTGEFGCIGIEVAQTLTKYNGGFHYIKERETICAGFMGGQGAKAGGIAYSEEVAPTIKSSPSGGNTIPDIVCQYGNVAGTLEARHDSSPCADRGMNIIACNTKKQAMNTLSTVHVPGVAYTQNCSGVMGVCAQATVRRLTPLECERLMGFPDYHTMIPWNGKAAAECPDSPRYKACGNSMCVNVMRWIGERIDAVEKSIQTGTFDQLFDAEDLELEGDETEMDEDAEAEYMVILEDQAKEIIRLKQENEQLRHTVAAYQKEEKAK